ncbi:hypothetical protein [Allobaculum sp. Allo2]|uniref:hypothetical protein n=1 Tax=Allobaculum sp. Allo2 TaxID=2853432 RepID=UPI001F60B4FA|nr:hypothetical protein [Allobaculum sp. Allo2]UNT93113.1 hypothetical protein KWG61_13985 [Allobaculum sp. Allo2]
MFEAEQNVFCLNKKRKGKEGMKLHKPADLTGRMLSVLLAGAVSFADWLFRSGGRFGK